MNAKVKVCPGRTNLEYSFYRNLEDCKPSLNGNVIFPLKERPYCTNVDSLSDNIYEVVNIVDPKAEFLGGGKLVQYPIFILKETTKEDTLCFKYDPINRYRFPFMVSGLAQEEDKYCNQILRREVDFANMVYYQTPSRGRVENAPTSIYRTLQVGDKDTYALQVRCYGTRPHSRVRGVTIFFLDGSRIVRNDAVVKVETTTRGYEYSAIIKLTVKELELLQSTPIAKQRIYIYDHEPDREFARILCLLSRCITKAK